MQAIGGNTFPVKDALKQLGGKWDPNNKAWMVPDDKVEEAKKPIYRSGECRDCYEERKMGY